MRLNLFLLSLVCTLACLGASGQQEAPVGAQASGGRSADVVEVVTLRNTDGAQILQRLSAAVAKDRAVKGDRTRAVPPWAGVRSIDVLSRTNALRIVGIQSAVDELKKRIDLLDVAAKEIWIHFKVLRFDFDAEGNWDMKIVSAPSISTLDGMAASLSTQGDADASAIELIPHLNRNGTVRIDGVLRAAGHESAFHKTIPPKSSSILVGVTDSTSSAVRRSAGQGRIPAAIGQPFSVFYLQVVSVEAKAGR